MHRLLLLLLLIPTLVLGASFDCRKASTYSEKTICGSAELSRLDEEMADLYWKARKNGASKGLLIDQREWLRDVRWCRDELCLLGAYRSRIRLLKGDSPREVVPESKTEPKEEILPSKLMPGADMVCTNSSLFVLERTKFWIDMKTFNPEAFESNNRYMLAKMKLIADSYFKSEHLVEAWSAAINHVDFNAEEYAKAYTRLGDSQFLLEVKEGCMKKATESGLK